MLVFPYKIFRDRREKGKHVIVEMFYLISIFTASFYLGYFIDDWSSSFDESE